MNPIPDPRKLLNQLQLQTQANRYAKLVKDNGAKLVDKIRKS